VPVFFYQFIKRLSTLYPEIFEEGGMGNPSIIEINHGKKWRGYASIVELANGDITKFNEIADEPLEKCLLYLSYKSDTRVVQDQVHRLAMKGM
jgi:hypothetical protein